ncbi:hypothetical protein DITRI_Ditri17bG0067200 [Diplodiscus trichospermus]
MGIVLAFTTLALSSLVVYFIYVCSRYLPSFIRESTALKYVTLIAKQLEWACHFLFCYSLFPNYNYALINMAAATDAGQRTRDYEWKLAGPADAGQCPLCLVGIEEGEEIGELRCGHVFHRFCLQTRIGYNNLSCPLFRCPLAPPRFEYHDQPGRDAIVFEFCLLSIMINLAGMLLFWSFARSGSFDHDRWSVQY